MGDLFDYRVGLKEATATLLKILEATNLRLEPQLTLDVWSQMTPESLHGGSSKIRFRWYYYWFQDVSNIRY